jgi:hypothetical protein
VSLQLNQAFSQVGLEATFGDLPYLNSRVVRCRGNYRVIERRPIKIKNTRRMSKDLGDGSVESTGGVDIADSEGTASSGDCYGEVFS